MELEQANRGSLLHGVSTNSKGKLIWTGSFESLQMFVEDVLDISDGTWGCPGGGAKQFKSEGIDIRWYPETKSIMLSGKLKDKFNQLLISLASITRQLANNGNEETDDHSEEEKKRSCVADTHKLSLETLNSHLEAIVKEVHANTAAVNEISIERTKGLNEGKLKELENELACSRKENHKLSNENSNLKSVNENLTERANNLSYILADLQGKTKNAEDERDSLITAMRLLVAELNAIVKENEQLNHKHIIEQSGSNEAEDCTTQLEDVVNPNIQLGNRFSVLGVQENNKGEEAIIIAQDQDTQKENTLSKEKKRKKKSKTKQTAIVLDEQKTKEADKPQLDGEQRQSKTSVVVAGDSIIKYVKGWELSNAEQNVSVKSFSGATVDDMGDFLKPSIRKHPDKLIIHAGTNDVRSSSPTTIAEKVTELAEQFKKESNNTRIIISSLVTRSDNQDLARKVKDTNNIIKSNCSKKKLGVLR